MASPRIFSVYEDIMNNFQVRRAKLADLPALLVLLPQLTSRPESAGAQMPSWERAEDILIVLLANPDHHLLVAEEVSRQKVVGTVFVTKIPSLTYGGRSRAEIEGMIVDENFRRRGIGRLLMQHAMELAAECYRIQLVSGPKPEQLAFYKSLGFTTENYVAHRLYL
jgi:ribosomal protein S18 acetylase RimI-like enzyme